MPKTIDGPHRLTSNLLLISSIVMAGFALWSIWQWAIYQDDVGKPLSPAAEFYQMSDAEKQQWKEWHLNGGPLPHRTEQDEPRPE